MHHRILQELLEMAGNIVRRDPGVESAPAVRLTVKASEPGGFFGSKRRQAMFCDRLAGGSTSTRRHGTILPAHARAPHRSV